MTTRVDYDHVKNRHTEEGAFAALSVILDQKLPTSLLDIGCGTGTWLKAALELGVTDVLGIDGVSPSDHGFIVPRRYFQLLDLSSPFDLRRRFDIALCLEVAEHLSESSALGLISSIVLHSDFVFFSAACPGQSGQHHTHCRWPDYWQELFNSVGFVCDDSPRWKIWGDGRIEPWYRQNLFLAKRDPSAAGHESRIPPVIHPDMIGSMDDAFRSRIEAGDYPGSWYMAVPFRVVWSKVVRRLSQRA